MSNRVVKAIAHFILRTPLEKLVAVALGITVTLGVLAIIEPAFLLRFRRSTHSMKVVPYICRLEWVCALADSFQALGQVPAIHLMITILGGIGTVLYIPLRIILLALTPEVLRSVIFLVGVPCGVLYLSCKAPVKVLRRTPGAGALFTWLSTASIIALVSYFGSSVLRWAVSDISTPLYLALLALILSLMSIEERLDEKKKATSDRITCSSRLGRLTLYLCGGVAGLWILRCVDAKRVAYTTLMDADRVMGGNYKVKAQA